MCIHNLCRARYCEGKKQGVRTERHSRAVLFYVGCWGHLSRDLKEVEKQTRGWLIQERAFETEEMASAKPPRQAEVWNVQGTEGARRSVWLEGRELGNGSRAQVLPMGPQGHGKRL